MAEIERAASAPVESSPSFADAYAELMGDMNHVPDAVPDEPAGDSPAASPETPDVDAPLAEPTGDSPADAAPETTQVDEDPFEGAAPATYRVNGQDRTFDGIQVLKDRSGIIESSKMELLLHRLSERDHLFETSQQRQKELSDLVELTRWTPEGATDPVTGAAALQARDLAYATARAERDSFAAVLSDPAKVAALLSVDANGNIVWNDAQVAVTVAQLENKKLQLSHAIERHYAGRQSSAAPAAPAAVAGPAPEAVADRLIQVTGVKGFEAGDKAWLTKLAANPSYVRKATATDAAQNPTLSVGEYFASPELIDLIHDRAQLLARSAKTVDAATQAGRENAAKIAAARAGQKPMVKAPAAKAPVEKTRAEEKADDYDTWYEKQQDAAAALMRQSVAVR